MFTIEQIKKAHSKVKSGADFPNYVLELINLGVSLYETFVSDGHTDYFDSNKSKISSDSKYLELDIADESNINQFLADLKDHQNGKTTYPTFCTDCAKSGVVKWVVRMDEMTCTYYDKTGNQLLVETIPQL